MILAKHLLTSSIIIVCFVVNSCYCLEDETSECKILAQNQPQTNETRNTNNNNNNVYGSLCTRVINKDTIKGFYKNCKMLDKDKNDSLTSLCTDHMSNQCIVEIELSNAINHQSLPTSDQAPSNCTKGRKYTFKLNSVRLPKLNNKEDDGDNGNRKLFLIDNFNSLDIKRITVTDSTFEGPIPASLMTFFRSAPYLTWNNVRFSSPLEAQIIEGSKVDYFTLENSTINGIEKGCFWLGPNVKAVDLKDNTMTGGGKIASGAFILSRNQCQAERRLIIENIGLTQANVDANFIQMLEANQTTATTCTTPLKSTKMNFTLTGNDFAHTLPERLISPFLHGIYGHELSEFNFQFDKIDCCIRDNKWLFDLLNETTTYKQGNLTKLQIDCNDIDANVYNLTKLIEKDDLCYYRNVYPILLIAIISILILAILMAVFSYICVYHVLQKHGHVIMLGGPSTISGSADRANPDETSEPIEIRSTQTDVPRPKSPVSSGIWAKLKSVSPRLTRSQAPPPGPKEVRLPKTGFKLPGFKILDSNELAARRKHEGQAKKRSHEAAAAAGGVGSGIARKSPHPHHPDDHPVASHLRSYRTESSIPQGPSVAGGKGVAGGSKLVAKHKTVVQSPQPDSKQSNLDELATKRSSDVKKVSSDMKKVSSATKRPAPAAVKAPNTDNNDNKSHEDDRLSLALKTTNY